MPNPREPAVSPMNRIRWGAGLTGLVSVLVVLLSCDGGGGTGLVDDDPTDGSAFVGIQGGFVSLGNQVRVDVPQGALGEGVMITIRPVPTPPDLVAEGAIGQAYRVEPVDLQLDAPFRLEIAVPESVRDGIPANVLTLRRSTMANAALAPAGVILSDIQSTGNGVSGSTGALGTFSAAGPQDVDPTANAGGDQDVVVGDRVDLNGSGSDPDGGAVTFSWVVTAPDGATVDLVDDDRASTSFVADQEGEYTAALTVTDDEGNAVISTATITARENRPPTADAGTDQTVSPGATVQLDGSGSSDPEGEALSFSWTVTTPDGSNVAVPAQATASFDATQLGQYEVTLMVEDPRGATATATITVTVVQGNRAPTADAGGDQSVAVGDEVQLDGFAQDPDGDPVTFTWTVLDPDGNPVTVTNPNQSLASFTATRAGTYTVTLTVDDGRGGTATSTIAVRASDTGNRAPIADAGPSVTVPLNADLTLDGSGSSDPDGDALTFAWVQTGGPDVTLDDPSARRPSFTTTDEDGATYTFELTVDDGEFTDTDEVTITAENMAPNVTMTGPALAVTDVEVTFTATATDPDGDALTFDWTVTDPSGVEVATGTGTSIAFTPDDFGAGFTIAVVVSDGEGHDVMRTRGLDVNLNVAGTYPGTTFATTRVENCQGLVPTGSTTEALVVDQPDPATVILRLSGLTDFIDNDPRGEIVLNVFDFQGTITVTDGSTTIQTQGTISGTFTAGPPPGMDLTFTFSPNALPSCVVSGTITK